MTWCCRFGRSTFDVWSRPTVLGGHGTGLSVVSGVLTMSAFGYRHNPVFSVATVVALAVGFLVFGSPMGHALNEGCKSTTLSTATNWGADLQGVRRSELG